MYTRLLPILLFLLLSFSTLCVSAVEEPFSVNVSSTKDEVKAGESFDVNIEIGIAHDYFIYKDKTRVEVDAGDESVIAVTNYPKAETKYDKYLEQNLAIYKKKTKLITNVSILTDIKPGKHDLTFKVFYQGCSGETCFIPQMKEFTVPINVSAAVDIAPINATNKTTNTEGEGNSSPGNVRREKTSFEKTIESKGLLGAMIFAFIAGIGLSFTPCIYPMIPITVAIIGGQSANRPLKGFYLSLFYVLGISVVYSSLGVVAASTGALFGSAINSPWVVGLVAAVFIGLAFSMFGVYELKLPSSLAEKFGGKKGSGVLGVFIMGMISGTVASPCVGPVLVSLLVFIASTGSKVLGFWLLFVLSWGMGLLLIAVGTFSGVLNVLPKSGAWMEMIRKVLGILLIGAAFYYVKGIVPEKIFLISLGIFLIIVGVFSGGLDRIVAESAVLSRVKKSFGILCIIFGIYFLVGTLLLKGLILSPLTFTQPANVNSDINNVATGSETEIEWITSEKQGLTLAVNNSTPVMIDFRADWCSVCKKLEKKTLKNPRIVEKSKSFINIKIDCTNVDDPVIKELWAKYGIVGLPTIIFIDKDGAVQKEKTVNGFIDPSGFEKIMESIL